MSTIKKTTKNIAKSNRTIANRFESDEQDLFLDKKGSTVMKDIAKTNNYIAKRLSIVTDDSDILNTSTPPTDENSFVTAGNIRDIYNVPYGIVGLNGSGLIDAAQLPSYVDDVIEGYYYNGAFYSDSSHQYEIVPETGKIYVDITDPDHSQSYRWSGSVYSIVADPREALFDVTFTEPVPGNLNSDKTLAEIEEAVNDGKVVRGFFGNITYYLTSIQHDTNVKFNAAIKNINYNIEGKYLNSTWNWSYNSWDLSNIKPDWNATAGADNEILNKPDINGVFYGYTTNNSNNLTAIIQNFTLKDGNVVILELRNGVGTAGNALHVDINSLGSKNVKYYDNNSLKTFYNNQLRQNDILQIVYSQTYDVYILVNQWSHENLAPLFLDCWTAADQNVKTVNATRLKAVRGQIIGMRFHYTNTAQNPKIRITDSSNINEFLIMYNGSMITTSNLDKAGKAGHVIYYMYDGTYWVWMGEDNAFSGDYNDLVNKPIPTPTQADSGKLLSVDANGDYELITIVNSENIAY